MARGPENKARGQKNKVARGQKNKAARGQKNKVARGQKNKEGSKKQGQGSKKQGAPPTLVKQKPDPGGSFWLAPYISHHPCSPEQMKASAKSLWRPDQLSEGPRAPLGEGRMDRRHWCRCRTMPPLVKTQSSRVFSLDLPKMHGKNNTKHILPNFDLVI